MKDIIGTKKLQEEQFKTEKQKKFAAVNYVLPFAANIMIIILYCLPLINLKDKQISATKNFSVFGGMSTFFSEGRKFLFSNSSTNDAVYQNFYKTIMFTVAILTFLLVLGTAVSFCYMLTGLSYIKCKEKSSKLKRLFLTFIPNRVTVFVFCFFSLIPSAFPHILCLTIEKMMYPYFEPSFIFGDLIIWSSIIFALPIIIFIATKRLTKLEFDIFSKLHKD